MSDDRLLSAITRFLDLNYPCSCPDDDEDCPGNYFEAVVIVEIVQAFLMDGIPQPGEA
ncbi:hypothetical protein AB1K54_10315 [Microbacterium sp. BWT-B31]|uniref:hypothetical protein n=1 Tax=Microbacterium sp. BWT-B31 TaxID=3232072 RepID=UPI0035291679